MDLSTARCCIRSRRWTKTICGKAKHGAPTRACCASNTGPHWGPKGVARGTGPTDPVNRLGEAITYPRNQWVTGATKQLMGAPRGQQLGRARQPALCTGRKADLIADTVVGAKAGAMI
jgi:hypothetical protein